VRAIISLASGKGGVGKTTSAANLAVALAQRGHRVLAWDLDGQGHLGQGLGLELSKVRISSYHLLTGKVTDISSAFEPTVYDGLTVIPAHMELFAAEQELAGAMGKEFIVKELLKQKAVQDFDIALLDLPPNLGFLTVNGFAASRWVIIPVQMSGFALTGLRQVAHAIRLTQAHLNPELELLGLLPTFVSPRTNFSRELLQALHTIHGTRIFEPYVPHAMRVAEGSLTGVPVVAAAPNSPAGQAYQAVAESIWEAVLAAPAHVSRAPAPSIAPPPRAPSIGDELVEELSSQPPALPRRRFWDIFRRLQRPAS
jgi:chromosome partitioning protein